MTQNQTAEVKVEERLAELAEERLKKQEQREAKEARAEERRKAMEQKRLMDMEALKVCRWSSSNFGLQTRVLTICQIR